MEWGFAVGGAGHHPSWFPPPGSAGGLWLGPGDGRIWASLGCVVDRGPPL